MTIPNVLLQRFQNRGPLLNIVLDGYGIGKGDNSDAVAMASTPVMDRLKHKYAHATLLTHGSYVGLPADDNLGGSEVGHLTLGAGKILDQGSTLIFKAINDGSFVKLPILNQLFDHAKGTALHLLGLLSDGNVHSHIQHFETVIRAAATTGVNCCYVHALLDGRDVGIQTAGQYAGQLQTLFDQINQTNPEFDYRFASAAGREVATMDRDQNWAKVKKGWDAHVLGRSEYQFGSLNEAIQFFRAQNPGVVDQDLPVFNLKGRDGKKITIDDGAAVLNLNFRADRAIEISQAFEEADFMGFDRERFPQVMYAGMMVYDEDTDLPKLRLVGSPKVPNPFGRQLVELGIKQFRLAETQKYAHVTFFYNGGYRHPLDSTLEDYVLINSDKIDSFADAPQMKALEVAAKAVELIQSGEYGFGLINFANADMVGHTGDVEATKIAVETVDLALGQVLEALEKANGVAVVTADHGNADEMSVFNKKKQAEEPSTKHSLNPVPVVVFDPGYQGEYRLNPGGADQPNHLGMVVATNYILMGLEPPEDVSAPLIEL